MGRAGEERSAAPAAGLGARVDPPSEAQRASASTLAAAGGSAAVGSAGHLATGAGIGSIKGAAVREFLLHAEATLPRERLDAALARLAGRDHGFDRSRPAFGVVASRWYEASQLHALLDGLVEALDPAARERLIEGGARAVMDATLRGIYKLLFDWMASPDRYARFAPKLWASYYDSGTFVVEPLGAHAARCTITGWSSHHPVICDLNRAAAGAIYEAMGCRGVTVERPRCLGEGDACDEFITRWQPRGPG